MIPKQDRQGVRHAKEIEQKYDLNKDFSSIEQMASNAQRAAEQANNKANSAVNATSKVAQSVGELSESVANNTESLESLDKRVDTLEQSGGGGSGTPGENGATFTPSVDSNGNLSWTNDKGLDNPATVNIKGDKGDPGNDGANATINGVNALIIQAGSGISLSQNGNVLIINASGGGGICPQIVVTTQTGATVTCTKGNTVLHAEEVNGTWTFNVTEFGEWTINASIGGASKSEVVTVDSVAQFKVGIALPLYLYNEGDECSDVTGGFSKCPIGSATNTTAPTKESDRIAFTPGYYPNWCTNNAIDVTSYTRLFAEIQATGTNKWHPWIGIFTARNIDGNYRNAQTSVGQDGDGTANKQVVSCDIASITGQKYIGAAVTGDDATGYVYKIWLE